MGSFLYLPVNTFYFALLFLILIIVGSTVAILFLAFDMLCCGSLHFFEYTNLLNADHMLEFIGRIQAGRGGINGTLEMWLLCCTFIKLICSP